MSRFVVGDMPLISNIFYTPSSTLTTDVTLRDGTVVTVPGTPADPSTITLLVTQPDGTVAGTYTYAGSTVAKFSTGVYDKSDLVASVGGTWSYKWTGTGTAADVQDGTFDVFAVGNVYCTPEQMRDRFRIDDALDDFGLERACRAASRRVESYTGRERFWRDAAVVDRVFDAPNNYCLRVPVGISTATGLVVKTDLDGDGTYEHTLTVSTDFILKPNNALAMSPAWPYDHIELVQNTSAYFPSLYGRPGVQITARFGWPAVPDDVSEAALILAHRLFKRKETSTGVVGFDGLGATVRLSRTDPDVAELLAPYQVFGIG